MRRIVVLCCAALCADLLCQGCTETIRGTEGDIEAKIKYGTLNATMDRGIDRVFEAVQLTIEELGLTTIMAEQDGVAAEVLARDAQEQNVTIKLEALSPNRTALTMRVGLLGDENKSRVIFREVQENLRAR